MDTALETQSLARKDRLAKLRSLKRKQEHDVSSETARDTEASEASTVVLSGRNYDVQTKAPRFGFDTAPSDNQVTLESQAESIAAEARIAIKGEEEANLSIDLLSLQPKKPNWDLKRDVDQKLSRLDLMTNNAIARILHSSILQAKTAAAHNNENLAELVKQRENEEAGLAGSDLA
ncbi:hypothetical protein TWF225_002640 [Orbilia oligospora]|nr:hypothetical protein TWF225_002640 [Orbilia oligospora]KAF3237028.1 hypothetical protein TWF128_001243 [Orbilia oligospora]KAF3251600.1 hypothetical protein TWF217_007939 [Orbilia oligospora]